MQMCFLCRMTTSKPPRRTCALMKVSGKNNQYFIIWLKKILVFCAVDKFWRFVCLVSLQKLQKRFAKDFNYLNAKLCCKGNKSYKLSQSRTSGAKCCCLHFQLQRETIKPCSASPWVSFQFSFLLIAAVVWGQAVWGERRAQVSRCSLLRRAGTKVANQEMRERAVSRIH